MVRAKPKQELRTALVTEEARALVLSARRNGVSYRDIAKKTGVSRSRCHEIVVEELAALRVECGETAEHIRDMALARLDELTTVFHLRARDNGDLAAAAMALKVEERRAKLLGLDGEQRLTVDLVNPDDAIAKLRAKLAGNG